MSSNGTAHVAAEMERPRPLKAAELSSQQRNALIDELVAVVNGNARAMAELRREVEAHKAAIDAQATIVETVPAWSKIVDASLDRHYSILSAIDQRVTKFIDRPFLQRLRWLVRGV